MLDFFGVSQAEVRLRIDFVATMCEVVMSGQQRGVVVHQNDQLEELETP